MKYKKMIAVFTIGTSLLLGGCLNMNGSSQNPDEKSKRTDHSTEKQSNHDFYVSVQDYTGQGYRLPNGNETDKIAEAHRDEVDKAAKKFFLDKYETKVKIHNIVGNKDGATVFVESIGEPHFHSYAIVPIDIDNKHIMVNDVWSQEGQVEDAIMVSIFSMIFDKELAKLNHYGKT